MVVWLRSDGTHQVESELLKLNLLNGDGAHIGPLANLMLHPLNINIIPNNYTKSTFIFISFIPLFFFMNIKMVRNC